MKSKQEKKRNVRSKDPIVWQGLLVKLENKLQAGQDEVRAARKTETILCAGLLFCLSQASARDTISIHRNFVLLYKAVLIRTRSLKMSRHD